MLGANRFLWGLALALVGSPITAGAQTPGQPTADGFALYDRLAGPLAAKSGVPAPAAAETPALGCQRYGQIAETIIRFAISSSLAPGTSLDSPYAEARRQAADLMVEDAQATLGQLAAAGATLDQCRSAVRSFGAAAFSLAQSVNRANVQRNADAVRPPAAEPKPATGPSDDELAAAKAAVAEQLAREQEAQRRAADKIEHAFANLGPVAPVPPRNEAHPLAFNIYLIDTPAMREAKDFRVCFEPGLYQRAAKPIVDLATASLEVPEATPVVDQAATDFFAKLRPLLAQRFAFRAERLLLQNGEDGAARGPVVLPVTAVSVGCHVYLASRPPSLAYDDPGTKFGLLAENVVEDVVTRPALEVRLAVLPKLESLLKPDTATASVDDAASAMPTSRADAARCAQDARCRAGVALAINACRQTAERRNGKAAIERELEAREQVFAARRIRADEDAAERDFNLISGNLELINSELGRTLDRLAQDGKRLRREATPQLSNQELDAAIMAGRDEGEQSMGTPVLQCYSRIADGRSIGLAAPQ